MQHRRSFLLRELTNSKYFFKFLKKPLDKSENIVYNMRESKKGDDRKEVAVICKPPESRRSVRAGGFGGSEYIPGAAP